MALRRPISKIALALTIILLTPLALRAENGAQPVAALPIYAIQGPGLESPFQDQWRDSYGIVTAVTSDGFYLQDPYGDGDPATSDGLFVYTYNSPTAQVGQCIYVTRALVSEFYGKTELSRIKSAEPIDACGAAQIDPVTIPLARFRQDPAELFEPYEGMLVVVEDLAGIVQGPTKRFRDGEIELGLVADRFADYIYGQRLFQHQDAQSSALIYLSNAAGGSLPDLNWGDRVVANPSSDDPSRAQDLVGILDYNFGKYQLVVLPGQQLVGQTQAREAEFANPATLDDFTVCSFNLFGMGRGSAQFPADADYLPELTRRARLIAENLQGCTIVALQEVGSPAVADDLARLLEAEFGLVYDATVYPGPGAANAEFPLNTGFLTRRDRVQVRQAMLRQGCSDVDYEVIDAAGVCPAGQFPLFNRPPQLLSAQVTGGWDGAFSITLINNHWKSKGGDESVNVIRREAQANHVASLVREMGQQTPDAHVVVVGDLNDFPDSAPVTALRIGVEPNLVNSVDQLAPLERYSYIFNSASQVLDHFLLTPKLLPALVEVNPIRVNADFASPPSADPNSTIHASDHDPLLIRLRPTGGAELAANWHWPAIELTLHGGDGQPIATTTTDSLGSARLWNLDASVYTLGYQLPDHLVAATEDRTLDLKLFQGMNEIESPPIQHRNVLSTTGAALASLALNDILTASTDQD